MTDKTVLVVPGRKLTVARPIKRTLQVACALCATAAVAFAAVMINAAFTAKGGMAQGLAQWLVIVKRPDIQVTALLTALVTVLFVYWQRGHERR